MKSDLQIVLTGVESSGKTTLAKLLANHLNAAFIPEYARQYLEIHHGYEQKDLLIMAQEQIKLIKAPVANKIKICDTDLQVIKIWSEVKYNTVDPYIEHEYKNNLPDLYILCKPDFPWQFDPLRENQNNQLDLHQLYETELERLKVPCIQVEGDLENRKNFVLTYLRNNFT